MAGSIFAAVSGMLMLVMAKLAANKAKKIDAKANEVEAKVLHARRKNPNMGCGGVLPRLDREWVDASWGSLVCGSFGIVMLVLSVVLLFIKK